MAMFDRFTNRTKKVMKLALLEAERFNHDYIGTEHILLGLIGEESGIATTVLETLGVDLGKTRSEIGKIVSKGAEIAPVGQLPFTPRAKKVMEYALEESRDLSDKVIGTEHLLLGLLREDAGVGAQVLASFGLKTDIVRKEVMHFLSVDQLMGGSEEENPMGIVRPEDLDEDLADHAASWADKISQAANSNKEKFDGKQIKFNVQGVVREFCWLGLKKIFKQAGWSDIKIEIHYDQRDGDFSSITLTR